MKRIFKHVFAALLASTFLVGVFAVASFATEENGGDVPELQITACTLSFDDSVYVMYALPVSSVAGAEVKMLYFNEPQTSLDEYTLENARYCESHIGVQNVLGLDSYVYKNRHMNAKNMTDVIYARAYAKVGETEYYSNLVKYSILEYAFNTLGGITEENPTGERLKLKELLESMLIYGAASQNYFSYNLENLATDKYYKITAAGGSLLDCSLKALCKEGDTLDIVAHPGSDGTVVTWYDSQGREVGNGEKLSITVGTSSETYTAVRSKKIINGVTFEDAEYVYDGAEKELLVSGDIPSGVSVTYENNSAADAGSYEAVATLAGDGYETLILCATLTINKADIVGVSFADKTCKYRSGATYFLTVTGTLPEGVEVEYLNNSAWSVGTYAATAILTGENYNTLVLEATLTITSSSGSSGGIVTPEHVFG